jgi:5-formyltetrahydrofolate cyclo-ligase
VKKSQRQLVKGLLANLSENQIQLKSSQLSKNLQELLNTLDSQGDQLLGGFSPIQNEPHWYLELSEKFLVSLPVVEENAMRFHLIEDRDLLSKKIISLSEEFQGELVEPKLLIIPGLAFSKDGHRLGRGGGFYDRFLSGFSGIRVAVCFEEQILEKIVSEEHDELVSYIVTDTNIYKVKD